MAGWWSDLTNIAPSKYAGIAILISIAVVAITVLVGKEPLPLSQKFAAVFIMVLFSLPAILLTLTQISCMITGAGLRNQRPWCLAYSWILAALVILYSLMLVVAAVISLNGDSQARVAENFANMKEKLEKFSDAPPEEAEAQAQAQAQAPKAEMPPVEGFEGVPPPMQEEEEPQAAEAEGFSSCGAPFNP